MWWVNNSSLWIACDLIWWLRSFDWSSARVPLSIQSEIESDIKLNQKITNSNKKENILCLFAPENFGFFWPTDRTKMHRRILNAQLELVFCVLSFSTAFETVFSVWNDWKQMVCRLTVDTNCGYGETRSGRDRETPIDKSCSCETCF